jgi:hypothetical protein
MFSQLPRVRYLLDQERVIEDLGALYGARSVIVGDFDDGWHKVLSQALGIAIPENEGETRHRVSVSDALAESIHALNELRLPDSLRYRILGAAAMRADNRDGLRLVLHLNRPDVLVPGTTVNVGEELERWIADNLAIDDPRWRVVDSVRDLIARYH